MVSGPPRDTRPSLVERARQAMAGGPPTQPIALRAQDGGLSEHVARGALELALRIGEAMLSAGAAAADVSAAVLRTAAGFGLTSCQVDVTFTSLTVSYDRGDDGVPLTLLRVVRARAADYTRLDRVVALAREAGDGALELEEAHTRLDSIMRAPHPYRRWLVTLALSGMAAAVASLLGGGWTVALVAALTTATVDRVTRVLNRWGLPYFFQQAVGAAIPTLVAVGLFVTVPYLPLDLGDLPPSLVVASGIVVLLAGLSLVGAAEDAISGFPVTAVARAFDVALLTLGIVVGIGAVLDLSRRAGVPLEVIQARVNTAPLPVQVLSAASIAAAWAIASYARARAVLVAATAGGGAWAVFSLCTALGVGPTVSSTAAALLVGFAGEALGSRLRVPPLVVSVCGIVPLLPGLAIYRAMYQLVDEVDPGAGAAGMLGAVMIGLGLAAGVTLGEFLATPLRQELDRWDRGVRRRSGARRD